MDLRNNYEFVKCGRIRCDCDTYMLVINVMGRGWARYSGKVYLAIPHLQ